MFNSSGAPLQSWDQPKEPTGIAFDKSGYLYIADEAGNVVHRLERATMTWNVNWLKPGAAVQGMSFNWTRGMRVDANGFIYVADTGNNRIVKLSPQGELIKSFGSPGSENGQLLEPSDLAIDAAGRVYVVDTYNKRIQKFTSDGEWLKSWDLGMMQPERIAIDSKGNLHVLDPLAGIKVSDSDGNGLRWWNHIFGAFPGGLGAPKDIAIDNQDTIYVVASEKILKFGFPTDTSWDEFLTLVLSPELFDPQTGALPPVSALGLDSQWQLFLPAVQR